MKTPYERRSDAIASLNQGDKPLRFTGCDHNGDEWTAHVHVNEQGAWQVDTMWGGPTIGDVTFHLRREFTKPEYAHDHLHSNSR